MDSAVSASYEICRRLHRRHDPTYYWAARRLPPDVRPATHALYGYVRTADEIVDGPGRAATPAAPLGELHAYMGSMRRDCAPVRMLTWEELCGYMDGSAGTVGRIMAPLIGVPERHHADYGRLGLAFQLTNFLRDLRQDYELDRVYLPLEDRERFGVAEADLAQARSSAELRALVAFEARRAREMFAAAEEAVAATPGSARTGVRLACAAYQRVLYRVERVDVLGRRAGLRAWMLPGVIARALHS